jgi:opacity protein-like surface antigen
MLLLAGHAAGAWSQEHPYYFRLDSGYSAAQPASFGDRTLSNPVILNYLVCGDPACNSPMSLDHLGHSAIAAAGFGWRFTPQLRADVTVGFRRFSVDGIDRFPESIKADVKSTVAMLSGYWDIPYEGRFKPFVGAGIGRARNTTGTVTETFLPPNFPGGANVTPGVKSSTAMSLSAGVGFEISRGVVVEVGYRYIDLGKFQTGNSLTFTGAFPFSLSYPGAQGNLRANEITVCIRF